MLGCTLVWGSCGGRMVRVSRCGGAVVGARCGFEGFRVLGCGGGAVVGAECGLRRPCHQRSPLACLARHCCCLPPLCPECPAGSCQGVAAVWRHSRCRHASAECPHLWLQAAALPLGVSHGRVLSHDKGPMEGASGRQLVPVWWFGFKLPL